MGDHGQVGRLGGDEFKAVLPGTVDIGLLESLARTLIEQVSRPYSIEGHRVMIGASVGIAIGDPGRCTRRQPGPQRRPRALCGQGCGPRQALLLRTGDAHARHRTARCSRTTFGRRSTSGELWVAYQPIVRTAGEEICGFEALVRWNHPLRGPISPDKFIPLAEECGLIAAIGDLGARNRARGSGEMARPGPHRGQPVADPVQRSRASSTSLPHALNRDRRSRRAARARDHRRRVPGRRRRDRRDLRPAEGRSASGLRSTISEPAIQLARLFEESAVRQDQDRPELRPRRGVDDQPQQRDHPRHRHARREPRHGHHAPKASRPTTTST